MRYGIDVSYANGYVDYNAVKNAGFEFVMARCGYGKTGVDDTFLTNVNNAHAAGLQVGSYFYSYALNEYEAQLEAQNCKNVIDRSGVLLELPVFYDMEDADGYKARHGFAFDPAQMTRMCRAFIDGVKPLDCGVYASLSWLNTYIDWRSLGCPVWNAQWSRTDDFKGYMWQYTDRAIINGKAFDANILYA